MNVKQGYKQTELGVIPEDWITTEFHHVLEGFSSGMTPYRGSPEYFKGDIPWVTSGELNYNTIIDTIEKITPDAVSHTGLKILKSGTFLMAITGLEAEGTRGSCALLGIEATTNQSCLSLNPKNGLISNDYLFQFYRHYGDYLALKYCQGTKQQSFTGGIVKTLPIILPPTLQEQQAIAQALSDADALIQSQEQLIAKKQQLKQAAMQELLTPPNKDGKRLPGFDGEWQEGVWEDVLSGFTSGMTPYRGTPEYYTGDVKWITSGELNYNIITDTLEKITEDAVNETNLKKLPVGTFLMAITGLEAVGTRGSCAIVGVEATTNQSCMAIFSTPRMTTDYLYHYYLMHGDELALRYCQGSKQQSYTAQIVKRLPITFPADIEEQTRIATILSDMDAEIAALQKQLAHYRQLKQGMMHQLLTGKTRLI